MPREWLRTAYLRLTDADLAAVLSEARGKHVARDTVRHMRRRMNLEKDIHGTPVVFLDSKTRKYDDPPILKTDDVLIMGDPHAPYFDADWCNAIVDYAVREGIKRVLVAGDLIDFNAISPFAKEMAESETDQDLADELDETAEFCDALRGRFEAVDCILGNHEGRLSRKLDARVRTKMLARILGLTNEKRFKFHPYFYAIIKSSDGQKWRITHPRNASVIPVRVAARLADKVRMNVVAAHGHDWGETTSASGYYAAACGACLDPDRLAYLAVRDNLRPVVQQGAWLLVKGRPVLLHPEYRRP